MKLHIICTLLSFWAVTTVANSPSHSIRFNSSREMSGGKIAIHDINLKCLQTGMAIIM